MSTIQQANEKVKNLKKKYVQNGIIIVVSGVVLILVLRSIAWFASNESVSATNMSAKVNADMFELEALSTSGEFSALTPNLSGIQSEMTSRDYYYFKPDHMITDKDYSGIYWRLIDEDPANDTTGTNEPQLFPGSYGTMSFYLVPDNPSDNLNVSFSFDFQGIEAAGADPSSAAFSEALDYLKGHVLFFWNRTVSGIKQFYSNRIDGNDTYVYSTADHQADKVNGKYLITLYWIWPKTFGQIVRENSDVRHGVMFNSSTARNDLIDYMTDNPEFFFRNVDNPTDYLSSYQSNNNSFIVLTDGYNNADQLIGEQIRYLIVGLVAEPFGV